MKPFTKIQTRILDARFAVTQSYADEALEVASVAEARTRSEVVMLAEIMALLVKKGIFSRAEIKAILAAVEQDEQQRGLWPVAERPGSVTGTC